MASSARNKAAVNGPSLIPAGELTGRPAIPLTRPIIVAGSRNNCRLHLISRTVSKAHALIVVTRHTVFVRDLASREGTFVNGEKISEQDLAEGDILKIGRFEFIFSTGGARLKPHREKLAPPAIIRQVGADILPVPLDGRVSLVGRRGSADIAFVEQSVSTAHAVIVAWEGKRYVRDLGSRTGTFVNGKQVHQQEITPGDQIRIGESDLVYEISEEGAGVEVVASPTESAVATAIAAQEIETVALSADDTAAPAEKPKVAAPAARIARPSSPVALDDSIAGEAADEPSAAVEPVARPLSPSVASTLLTDTAAAEPLSRRGWHRGGADAEDIAAIAPTAETSPKTPFDFAEDLQLEPSAPELNSEVAESTVPPVEPDALSLAPLDDRDTAAADAPEASNEASDALTQVEVIDSTDVDSAQPLETVAPGGVDEPAPEPQTADELTDTVFSREVKALTDTRLGEPVELAGEQPSQSAIVEPEPSAAAEEIAVTAALPLETIVDEPATGPVTAEVAEPEAQPIDWSASVAEAEVAPPECEPLPAIELRAPVTPVADLSQADPIELEADEPEPAAEVEVPAPLTVDELPNQHGEVAQAGSPAAELPLDDSTSQSDVDSSNAEIDWPHEPLADLAFDAPPVESTNVASEAIEVVSVVAAPPLAIEDASQETASIDAAEIEGAIDATVALPLVESTVEESPTLGVEPTEPIEPVEPPVPLAIDSSTEDVAIADPAPLDDAAIDDLLSGADQTEATTPPDAPEVDPLLLSATPPAVAANAPLALEDFAELAEPEQETLGLDDAPLEATEAASAHETAFAVAALPLPAVEPAGAEVGPPETSPLAEEVAATVALPEPPVVESPSLEPAAIELPALEPPPMPANAPPVTPVAETDDEAGILIAPTPRRPAVVRDGFNRRGRRSVGESSPFAGRTGAIEAADPFGAMPPGDAFSTPSPASAEAGMESLAPPSEIALPPEESAGADAVAVEASPAGPLHRGQRPRDPRALRRPRPEAPSFGPDIGVPLATLAEDSPADLHELRRRRLRLIPTLLIAAVLLGAGSMGAIWKLFPVTSEFEVPLKFSNFEALTVREQQELQQEQVRLLRLDVTRQKSLESLRSTSPKLASGFLGSTVGFDRVIMLSGWPEARPGEFAIRYRGNEAGDRERVHAVSQAMHLWNIKRNDNTTRVRAALRDAQDKLDANTRKLADLRADIEKERVLGESRPMPGEVERLETAVLESEKRWTEALADLKEAQAEESRIDKLLHSAQDNPPPPPEQDAELASLTEQLTAIQAEYKAFQTRQSEQAAVARGEIDAAMDSFQKQIEAARGQGADSPELTQYIAAAENLQKTARELVDEMIDRQQKQYQQLSELKANLDDKARQRAVELRNSDPQLKEFYEKRELYRRQVNAAIGSGLDRKDFENVEDQLKLTENMIKSREDLLSSDPLHVETITRLQAMIDGMQADIVADRKKADEKMEQLQKSFAASAPTVSNLPEEQRKLAEQVREQLGGIALARKRYADIVEADRIAAETKLNDMQGRIVVLQGEVESRKKLLADEFASKSVTALTASLEAQRKVLTDALAAEAAARAEFESQGKALRQARDTMALLQNSDERMARLIAERETTEGLVATFNRDLNFRLEESKRQVEVIAPPVEAVLVNQSEDRRPIYMLIAGVSILVLTAAGVFWTLHSANRLEFASPARTPAPPSPRPLPEKAVDSGAGEDTPTAIA